MKTSDTYLYRHIRAWRRRACLTQEDVAAELEISNTVLSEKERGVRSFKPNEIRKLSEIFKEDAWLMVAFAPDDPRVAVIKEARALVDEMTPEQRAAWLSVGRTMTGKT